VGSIVGKQHWDRFCKSTWVSFNQMLHTHLPPPPPGAAKIGQVASGISSRLSHHTPQIKNKGVSCSLLFNEAVSIMTL
jgi:hypothetical protein